MKGIGLHKLRAALRHPIGRERRAATIAAFVRWRLASSLSPGKLVYPFVGGTSLVVSRACSGDEMNLLVGLGEFAEMGFLLHCLRPSDLFVDAGANIGAHTVLVSGVCGAESIAIEPAPATFVALEQNVAVNGLRHLVRTVNAGLAETSGDLAFAPTASDVLAHVATGGETGGSIRVRATTLDEIVADRDPLVLKLDIEGYELAALRGGRSCLARTSLRAVLLETNGLGNRYGLSDDELHALMTELGFVAHSYDPLTRSLHREERVLEANTIYVRDLDYVTARLRTARALDVLGTTL